jgi:hypothetical protein
MSTESTNPALATTVPLKIPEPGVARTAPVSAVANAVAVVTNTRVLFGMVAPLDLMGTPFNREGVIRP